MRSSLFKRFHPAQRPVFSPLSFLLNSIQQEINDNDDADDAVSDSESDDEGGDGAFRFISTTTTTTAMMMVAAEEGKKGWGSAPFSSSFAALRLFFLRPA